MYLSQVRLVKKESKDSNDKNTSAERDSNLFGHNSRVYTNVDKDLTDKVKRIHKKEYRYDI